MKPVAECCDICLLPLPLRRHPTMRHHPGECVKEALRRLGREYQACKRSPRKAQAESRMPPIREDLIPARRVDARWAFCGGPGIVGMNEEWPSAPGRVPDATFIEPMTVSESRRYGAARKARAR